MGEEEHESHDATAGEADLISLLVREVKTVYRETYVRTALHLQRLDGTQRAEPEVDVDYDPREDKLYIWYDDPVIVTAAGKTYAGAFLTGYPDTVPNVSKLQTTHLLAFVRQRAEHHAVLDARVNGIRSTAKLKACYWPTIIFLHGACADDEDDEAEAGAHQPAE